MLSQKREFWRLASMPQRRKLTTSSDQKGLLDSIQGYYAAAILLQLSRLGILENLASPIAAKPLASEHQVDLLLLEQVLEFLTQTTSLIVKKGKRQYQLGESH